MVNKKSFTSEDARWQALAARDVQADGTFRICSEDDGHFLPPGVG